MSTGKLVMYGGMAMGLVMLLLAKLGSSSTGQFITYIVLAFIGIGVWKFGRGMVEKENLENLEEQRRRSAERR